MEREDLKYWLALNKINVIRGNRLINLVESLGSAERVWEAKSWELEKIKGMTKEVVAKLEEERKKINPDEEIRLLKNSGAKVITLKDRDYPASLKNIHCPPPLLFFKGEIKDINSRALAIVGARRCDYYGKENAFDLAYILAKKNFAIISGMARGIDTFAHRGAIKGEGRTVAVLGSGIDVIYPPENKKLADEIIEKGAIISEFPLGTKPLPFNFPVRNRIISGLSLGVIVIQAAERSGAFITANFALEQGKEVFAVPGSINNPLSKGCHKLIKEGAKLVEDVNDILVELGEKDYAFSLPSSSQINLSPEAQLILNNLSFEPIHIDTLINTLLLPAAMVSSALLILEMEGLIKQLPGKMFVRVK